MVKPLAFISFRLHKVRVLSSLLETTLAKFLFDRWRLGSILLNWCQWNRVSVKDWCITWNFLFRHLNRWEFWRVIINRHKTLLRFWHRRTSITTIFEQFFGRKFLLMNAYSVSISHAGLKMRSIIWVLMSAWCFEVTWSSQGKWLFLRMREWSRL